MMNSPESEQITVGETAELGARTLLRILEALSKLQTSKERKVYLARWTFGRDDVPFDLQTLEALKEMISWTSLLIVVIHLGRVNGLSLEETLKTIEESSE